MKKIHQIISLISLVSVILLPNIIVIAQEVVEDGEAKLEPGKTPTQEQIEAVQNNSPYQTSTSYQSQLQSDGVQSGMLVNCFDTYEFGSIKINISQDQSKYEPGNVINLTGDVMNENSYPVTGLTVSARLVKDIPNSNDQAYTTTIDEFIIVENITIKANSKIDINQLYDLNVNAPKGKYQILFFAYQKDRFTLSGLPFTDDVVGSVLSFEVGGENTEKVYLDQTRTTVGGQKNINHGFLTTHEKDKDIQVQIPLKNITNQDQEMTLTSQLYSWDSLRAENLKKSEEEIITVPANGEILLTKTIEKVDLPVYYLKLTATQTGDVGEAQRYTTISNIRFAVLESSSVRFNWVGLNSFPNGDKVVTCIHNTSDSLVENIEVDTRVLNSAGKEIAKSLYKGVVTGQVDAIAADLPKNTGYDKLTVVSTIKDVTTGVVIDSVSIEYDCNSMGIDNCPIQKVNATNNTNNIIYIIIGFLGILLIYLRYNKGMNNSINKV